MKIFVLTAVILIVIVSVAGVFLIDTAVAPAVSGPPAVSSEPGLPDPAETPQPEEPEHSESQEIAGADAIDFTKFMIYIEPEPPNTIVTVTISAAGDVTLGGDPRGSNQFIREFERNDRDHSVFLRNVKPVFDMSDLSIVNLEGALTESTAHRARQFVFRGPPHFAKILSTGGVDVVTLANNHTIDFLDRGYRDTIEALEAEGVAYFGNEFNTIMDVNGIKVGLFGFSVWYDASYIRNNIASAIEDLKERGAQVIIGYFHWGFEHVNMPHTYQRNIGRFTIDSGADLLLGAHPHVLQGIEVYKGKNIVYSLANFSFGGNNHPADQDTFIFQQTFTFDNGILLDTNETNIIPARISSVRNRNDFQPILVEGEDAERILRRMDTYSEWVAGW